jgi:hypothetical protein
MTCFSTSLKQDITLGFQCLDTSKGSCVLG